MSVRHPLNANLFNSGSTGTNEAANAVHIMPMTAVLSADMFVVPVPLPNPKPEIG